MAADASLQAVPGVVGPASTARDLTSGPGRIALAVTRVLLGFVFLWAFLDKAFGLGVATPAERAWTAGGSPTTGFLMSVDGTFAGLFHAMAGRAVVDWAFMLGLLFVGVALTAGIAMRLAAIVATLLMGSLWLASLPLENNPAVDQHIIYAALAVALAATRAGHTLGLGRRWESLDLFPGWRRLA
jgi:thiosulfate dehydrogenase [quinone] large subunit